MPHDDKPQARAQTPLSLRHGTNETRTGDESELKPPRVANEKHPLKLTRLQRDTLLECTQLKQNLKKKIEQAGEGTQIVSVTSKELEQLDTKISEAIQTARSPHKKRLMAVADQLNKFFEEAPGMVPAPAAPKSARSSYQRAVKPTNTIYQLKITLLGIKPPIWRRIQVEDCTLDDLHIYIQAAMGWNNYHLYHFYIMKDYYGDPSLLGSGSADDEVIDSSRTLLSTILSETGKNSSFEYMYDMGDSWEHEILFEGSLPVELQAKYPRCVDGKRACPPEDCGGVWGYANVLKAIRGPAREEYQELREWVQEGFDPEAFDPNKANKRLHGA